MTVKLGVTVRLGQVAVRRPSGSQTGASGIQTGSSVGQIGAISCLTVIFDFEYPKKP